MSASNNSQRPNESSAEDELDDEDDDEEIDNKKQNGANGTDVNNKTLLVSLLKQINMLHETNSKIFRNLHETKGKWVMCKVFYLSNQSWCFDTAPLETRFFE